MGPETKPEGTVRKRVRMGYGANSKKKTHNIGGPNFIRSKKFENGLNWLMLGAAAVFGIIAVFSFHNDTVFYGFRPLYGAKAEYLYGFGVPTRIREDATRPWRPSAGAGDIKQYDQWGFDGEDGSRFDIGFDPVTGLSNSVSCGGAGPALPLCPPAFGVAMGDAEDEAVYDLGAAPRSVLAGTQKTLIYPSIGLAVELEKFKVRRITVLGEKSPIYGRIPRFIRWAVP